MKTNELARDFGREGVQLAFRLRLRLGGESDVVSAFGAATDALMLAIRLDFTDLEQAATSADTLSALLRAANTSFLKSAQELIGTSGHAWMHRPRVRARGLVECSCPSCSCPSSLDRNGEGFNRAARYPVGRSAAARRAASRK